MSLLLFLTKSTYRVLKATMKVVLWTRVRTGCEWKCPMPAFTLEISFLGHQEQPRAVQNYFLIVAVISTLWPGCDIFCFAIMALEKRFIGHYHSENSNSQSKNLMWRLLQLPSMSIPIIYSKSGKTSTMDPLGPQFAPQPGPLYMLPDLWESSF